jgi:hypothetical protein
VLARDGSWVTSKHRFAAGGYVQGTRTVRSEVRIEARSQICLISRVARPGMTRYDRPLLFVIDLTSSQILPYVSDRRPITSFAARLLNKLVGERDWSAQEISHILLKIPQQKSTRQCMVLDCRPDQAQDRHIRFDDG